jgi:7,8-dihydropterin-6-yl-methyl-4-(beta-D-ribofuranosyl)aminobenzene 5'-phosphate synthase
MHCSGNNFVQAIQAHMPDRLVLSTTGSLLTFGA